jgi:hypothetical protein
MDPKTILSERNQIKMTVNTIRLCVHERQNVQKLSNCLGQNIRGRDQLQRT